MAKEMLILAELQLGASMKILSEIIGISSSALSRRHDAVRLEVRDNENANKLASEIIQQYRSMRNLRIAKSQACSENSGTGVSN